MHRNDWLPHAEIIADSRDGGGAITIVSMCFGTIDRFDNVHDLSKSPRGRQILDNLWKAKPLPTGAGWRALRFPRSHTVHWKEPCRFVSGHPGACATELPDIFDERGNVRPAIARVIERARRRNI